MCLRSLPVLVLALAAAPAAAQHVPELVPHEYVLSFRISAPADWEVLRDQGGARWAAVSRLTGSGDTFRESVNLVTEEVATPTSLSRYLEDQLARVGREVGPVQVLESDDRVFGGQPASRLVYQMATNGREVRAISYIFILSGRAYVLTGTAEADQFDEYLPTFEAMARTFAL